MRRYWLHDWWNRKDPHHAMLQVVEAHIRDFPHEWEWTQYTATNRDKRLCIWIANEAYGLKLNDGLHWHGCPQIDLSSRWRHRLWRTIKGRGSPTRAREIVERFKEQATHDNVISFRGTNA